MLKSLSLSLSLSCCKYCLYSCFVVIWFVICIPLQRLPEITIITLFVNLFVLLYLRIESNRLQFIGVLKRCLKYILYEMCKKKTLYIDFSNLYIIITFIPYEIQSILSLLVLIFHIFDSCSKIAHGRWRGFALSWLMKF